MLEDHRSTDTPTPDDPRPNTTLSDTRWYNKTLNTFQERLFHIAEKYEHTSPDEQPDFRHTVDKHDYPIEEDNIFTKYYYSDNFILPINPSETGFLIEQTVNALIY